MTGQAIFSAIYGVVEPIVELETLQLANKELPIVLKHLQAMQNNSNLIARWFDPYLIVLENRAQAYVTERIAELTTSSPAPASGSASAPASSPAPASAPAPAPASAPAPAPSN